MPLVNGQPALQSSLNTQFGSTVISNTAAVSAKNIANYYKTFAETGVPMTTDTGLEAPGQAVSANITTSPGSVTASGVGGIDTSSPGETLASAKAQLIIDLKQQFSNTTLANTDLSASSQMSKSILKFLSQASILTNVNAVIPPGQSVPGVSGPVGPGSFTGTGIGGIDSSTPGIGLDAGLPTLIKQLNEQFSSTVLSNTAAKSATNIANYVEEFYLKAIINTNDTGTASGGTAVLVLGNGSTTPPGSPANGNGTGTIT